MKTIISILGGLWLCVTVAYAQNFKTAVEAKLPEPLTHVQMEWIAIDSDTLLDVVVAGVAADGKFKIVTFQNKISSLQFSKSQDTGLKDGNLQLADWNSDNRIDLLIAGKTSDNTNALFVFRNNGDFTFPKSQKLINEGNQFRVADFSGDGKLDLLTFSNGGGSLKVYENVGATFRLAYDSVINASDAVVFDQNEDSFNDFVVSGHDATGQTHTTLFVNQNKFKFRQTSLQNPIDGRLSVIDQNSDGLMDLIAVGKTSSGDGQRVWLNDVKTLNPSELFPAPISASLFSGDMNSDGIADAVINGFGETGEKVNYIRESSSVSISVSATGLILQKPGDFDRDGDLDIAQLKDSLSQQWIKIIQVDNAAINQRPKIPLSLFAFSTFGKTFINWESSPDDHTPRASLTYDVWLSNGNSSVISPDFDLIVTSRQTVTRGNTGTQTSKIIRGLPDGHYEYLVQAVDQAYNGSKCVGGSVLPCFDLSQENVNACKEQTVILTASENAVWFSSVGGPLTQGISYEFKATKNDTLFSFVPQQKDCSKNKVWIINVFDPSQLSQKEVLYVCEGKKFKLGIGPGWKNIEWNTSPVSMDVDTISLTLTNDRVITVTATPNTTACSFTKEFTIHISKPKLTLNGETFRALKGNPVQLEAFGIFKYFLWTPPTGLSNTTIGNPIAEPTQTTSYVVTATDSVGCVATGKVDVRIEFTAFVPNLFTPNGDNKNDELLIYGLGSVDGFQFQIFNREGSVVYETSSTVQVTGSGWNGTVRGSPQPSGVYYWKIEGTTNGEHVLLNGKKTGSILLVH